MNRCTMHFSDFTQNGCRVSRYICSRLNFLGEPRPSWGVRQQAEPPFRTGLCFTRDVTFFFSPRSLRDPSTDRPETLPHDRNLAVLYKLTSKIWGCSPPKKLGPKTCKISVNFGRLQSLFGRRQQICEVLGYYKNMIYIYNTRLLFLLNNIYSLFYKCTIQHWTPHNLYWNNKQCKF